MAVGESVNTALQNAFIKYGDGDYGLKVSSLPYPGQTAAGPNAETGFAPANVVTAPAADTVIATHTPPGASAGFLHKIEAVVWLAAGTPAAADDNNMAFKFGNTVISRLPVPRATNVVTRSEFYFKAAAGTPFTINSVGAATAGVVYGAFLTATKVVS